MIDESFVKKIEDLGVAASKVQEFDIHGMKFTDRGLVIVDRPTANAIGVHTLQAIVDYFKDDDDMVKPIISILDPTTVMVRSSLDPNYRDRESYITATCITDDFEFGRYMDVERFIIALQAQFEKTETVENIMRLVGNLSAEASLAIEDDGVTQRTQARTGVANVENVSVPNPVSLIPRRTFPEVDQPESEFVFRLKGSVEDGFQCCLFEADGSAWKLSAISYIQAWLKEKLPEAKIIA